MIAEEALLAPDFKRERKAAEEAAGADAPPMRSEGEAFCVSQS